MRGLFRHHAWLTLAVFGLVVALGVAVPAGPARASFVLTLSKTASPTTYTAAGQTITYTYVIGNPASGAFDTATNIALSDNKIGAISCPSTSIAPASSMTCTASYTITAADVAAGSVSNLATVTGDVSSDHIPDAATAQATINLIAQPSWTLSKTASPTSYSAAGQAIAYRYTLTNTGNVSISGIAVSDDKVAAVSCAATNLAIGDSTTCTGSYTTTAADVTAGSVTNTATAHGTAASGNLGNATAQATIRYKAPPKGTLTIVDTTSARDGSFQFSSTLPGASGFTLTTANGNASRNFSNLTPGTYVVQQVGMPFEWTLTALSCVGDTGGAVTTTNLGSGSVSIGLDGGEAIVCTFVNQFQTASHRRKTQDIIHNFLSRRLRQLANDEPDRARIVRRVPSSLWNAMGGTPISITGNTEFAASSASFSTSLSRIADAAGKANALSRALAKFGVDVWTEGHFSEFRDAAAASRTGIVYLGADYLLTPSVLVGALVQRDWTLQLSKNAKSRAQGGGFMAGPYVSAKLTPQFFVDARAAWGTSNNSINPFGLYTDRFKTDRWLANTRLTGNFHLHKFRITPSIDVSYLAEHQHHYTDSLGVLIPGQTVALGRLRFGPEISRRYQYGDGTSVEPELSLSGEWDFQNPDVASTSSFYVPHAALHARVEAGLQVHGGNGFSVHITASYDGIATSSFGNFGAQAWVSIPVP